MDFFDRANIHVQAGRGGNGSAHMRREKFVPLGGPDGGDGGRGGSVYLEADTALNTLVDFHYHQKFRAEEGGMGLSNRRHGKSGADCIIHVPAGTIVVREPDGVVIADLTEPGQQFMAARGGRGGLGNTHFATPTHQAPREAQFGEPGEVADLRLELKLIADVGLVGAPNAGKSTLLSVVTAARPKIADYPFTTLIPNLGVVVVGDYSRGSGDSFIMADIPGLIEGASQGVGLGHDFLRHIERTRLLLHLVDGSDLENDPWTEFEKINSELQAYSDDLTTLPQLAVFTKVDLPDAQERWPEFERKARQKGLEVFAISAASSEGVQAIMYRTAELLRTLPPRMLPETAAFKASGGSAVIRPQDDDRYTISKEQGIFVVSGKTVDRIVAMTNPNNEEGMARLEKRLSEMGVFEKLENMGVQPGDTVRFGQIELLWGEM